MVFYGAALGNREINKSRKWPSVSNPRKYLYAKILAYTVVIMINLIFSVNSTLGGTV